MSNGNSSDHGERDWTLPLADLSADKDGIDMVWPSICENIDCTACRQNISNIEDFFALPSVEDIANHDRSSTSSDRDSGIVVDSSPVQHSVSNQATTPTTPSEPQPSTAPAQIGEYTSPVAAPTHDPWQGPCTLHPPHEMKEFVEAINSLPAMIKPMHDIFGDRLHQLAQRLNEQQREIEEVADEYSKMSTRLDEDSAELEATVSRDVTGIDAKVTMALECLGVDVTCNQSEMGFASRLAEQLEGIEKTFDDRVRVLEDKLNRLAAIEVLGGLEERLAAMESKIDQLVAKQRERVQITPQKRGATQLEGTPSSSPLTPMKKAKTVTQGSSTRGKEPSSFPAKPAAFAAFKSPTKALERLHQRQQETGRARVRGKEDGAATKGGSQ